MHLIAALAVLAIGNAAYSATITWTNNAGGNWSGGLNWNPNQVPGAGDTAVITSAGNYTVTVDTSPTVGGLVLGGTSGTQTFLINGTTFTLNGTATINSHGQFNFAAGVLAGTNVITGTLNFSGGFLESTTTITTNSVLNIAASSGSFPYLVLTNYGTVNEINSALYGGLGTHIYNYGSWNLQSDDAFNGGYYGAPVTIFDNFGTYRKSSGINTATLDANTVFNNSGTVNVQSGTLAVSGGGASGGSGTFNTSGGGVINFASSYTFANGGNFTGTGNVVFGGGTVTLNGLSTASNLQLTGATLVGTNVIAGTLTWSGGFFESTTTIATNSVLNIALSSATLPYLVLTNYGTVNETNSILYGGLGTQIYNYGLWNLQSDDVFNGGYYGAPTTVFDNFGTYRKSSGTNTATLDLNTAFNNSGTVNVQSGTLSVSGGGVNSGTFNTAGGAGLVFNGSYTFGSASFTGAGGVAFASGTATLNGSVSGSNLQLTGATLVGTNVIAGTLTWSGGFLESTTTLTTNSVLNIALASASFPYLVLTNYGTVNEINSALYGGLGTHIYNYGSWNLQSDDAFNGGYYGSPVTVFDNFGTYRKSSGVNTATLDSNTVFNNSGTVNVQSGTLAVNVFSANAGNYTGNGIINLAGTTTLNGLITGSNLQLTGGTLTGTNVLAGTLTWSGGYFESTTTIATNSVLNIAVASASFPYLVLTNYGTVNQTNSALYGGVGTSIYNYGLWNEQSDDAFYGGYYSTPVTVFDNFGTYRKSSGTNTASLDANTVFNNSGTVNVQSGTLAVNYIFASGGFYTGNGIINLAGTTILNGLITGSNLQLTAGTMTGTNVLAGQLSWLGGYFESTTTVATNSILNIALASASFPYLVLTNYGTVNQTNSTLYGGVGTSIYNYGLWNEQSDDAFNGGYYGGTSIFDNFGIYRKSGGTTITYINTPFYNTGTLDAQTGIIDLTANYSLTGGRLNFGLNSPTNYGQITLSGSPAALDGVLSVNFNNGYSPVRSNSFNVVAYAAESGTFTGFILTNTIAWQTNYNPTAFNLTVLNSAPILPGQTNRTVNELTTLTVTNTATDFDLSPDTLTYSFLAAPGTASISPAGIITWVPSETDGPGTNIFTTRVVDSGTPSLSATNTFTVFVNEVNVAPVLPANFQTNVNELATLTVTNTATDSDIPINPLTYTLLQAPANVVISTNGVITWTPSQLQSPGTNIITTIVTDTNVFAVNAKSLSATNSITVVVKEVNVPASLPAISTQTVNELTLLTVPNIATNFNIHSTNSGYGLISPPAGMAVSVGGVITWTPSQTQSPSTNLITTVVTNSNPYDLIHPNLTSTNQFTVIVKEINVAPTPPTVSTQIVNELTLLTVTNAATNSNIHSTIAGYTLVSPPSGMVIGTNGVITWTPAQTQSPGTNLITTIVTNSNPYDLVTPLLTATNTFTVVVKEVNVAPTLPVIPVQTVNAQSLLTVTNTAAESNIHATVGYALLSAPAGVGINANGIITWTPTRLQGPSTNTITTVTTNTDSFDTVNPHLSATNISTVIVYAPTLAAIGNYTVNAGQTVAFTASATDNDPTRTLTFSLVSPPGGATINGASGVFNWRVPVSYASSTTNLQVSVTDNSTPTLSDSKSFTVTVNPLAPIILTPLGSTNGQFKLQVSGTTGPDYIISASGTLTNWNDLATNLSPTPPFQFTDTNAPSTTNRFYRARLSP